MRGIGLILFVVGCSGSAVAFNAGDDGDAPPADPHASASGQDDAASTPTADASNPPIPSDGAALEASDAEAEADAPFSCPGYIRWVVAPNECLYTNEGSWTDKTCVPSHATTGCFFAHGGSTGRVFLIEADKDTTFHFVQPNGECPEPGPCENIDSSAIE